MAVILEAQDIIDKIQRIAQEIKNNNSIMEDVVLVGIRTCGAYLAERLSSAIACGAIPAPRVGILDITLYRDDWTRIGHAPVVGTTELPFCLDDKTVILVDDVLFTGRTVRAAMDALIDYGRPRKIELAVLIDRGIECRELPIMANYTGCITVTRPEETINVYLEEAGSSSDHVAIEKKEG